LPLCGTSTDFSVETRRAPPRLEAIQDPQRGCLTEAFARSLIGSIVALYLDHFGPEARRARQSAARPAVANSESLRAPQKPLVKRSAS
jgi:hypothetical protein